MGMPECGGCTFIAQILPQRETGILPVSLCQGHPGQDSSGVSLVFEP